MLFSFRRLICGAAGVAGLWAGALCAQERIPSHCIALSEAAPELVWRADWREPVAEDAVRIRYLHHAMFLLQTPGGRSVVTDYTGYLGAVDLVPDVVTMNHAHSTHWTSRPDPRIPHVLEGWGEWGKGQEHWLDLGELLVRNVMTDIRSGQGGVEPNGNSIFVFEMAGLCIGHLGHLHHPPTPQQYAMLGRIDVLMVPVDGGLTLDLPTMMEVVARLRSSVVIPMHWFSEGSLQRFLAGMSGQFLISRPGAPQLELSLRSLPARPTIIVLEPGMLR